MTSALAPTGPDKSRSLRQSIRYRRCRLCELDLRCVGSDLPRRQSYGLIFSVGRQGYRHSLSGSATLASEGATLCSSDFRPAMDSRRLLGDLPRISALQVSGRGKSMPGGRRPCRAFRADALWRQNARILFRRRRTVQIFRFSDHQRLQSYVVSRRTDQRRFICSDLLFQLLGATPSSGLRSGVFRGRRSTRGVSSASRGR